MNRISVMNRYRPQFNTRGMLLATFWMAVCCASFAMVARMHRLRISSPLENILTLLMMFAPFVAIGALFGRSLLGAVVGVVALSAFWFVFFLT